jgi:hypothetical protein
LKKNLFHYLKKKEKSFYQIHTRKIGGSILIDHIGSAVMIFCCDQVRLAKIQDGGDVATTLLGEHAGRAHNLVIEPGSPYIFYSCGEDGLVQYVSY